jgi:hypothetical protein
MVSQMFDSACNGCDRTHIRVSTAAETDDFVVYTVVLGCECESHESGLGKVIVSGRICRDSAVSDIKLDVCHTER